MRYISGTKLDERVIRCDLDSGYREGRQYGRGKSGGQVRFYRSILSVTCLLFFCEGKITAAANEKQQAKGAAA